MTNGSSVVGRETPFVDAADTGLAPPRRGDLQMTLLLPENHGLVPGSEIRFRGMRTGEVRMVQLANDGTHVRLGLRIDRQYRSTVTDQTVFWVARPRLSGGLVGGMSLDDLGAILSSFIGYHTAPGEGQPVADGFLVAAEPHRPEISLEKVSTIGVEREEQSEPVERIEQTAQLVRVIYTAVEDDWWSADDHIRREGTGVLFEDREGQLLVLTSRSVCDANYFDTDVFGMAPDISAETFTIVLTDGNVVRARRTWAASSAADMALLTVDADAATRQGIPVTSGEVFSFTDEGGTVNDLVVRSLDGERKPVAMSMATLMEQPSVTERRGALVLRDGKIIGLIGQTSGQDETLRLVSVQRVPETLRPRP